MFPRKFYWCLKLEKYSTFTYLFFQAVYRVARGVLCLLHSPKVFRYLYPALHLRNATVLLDEAAIFNLSYGFADSIITGVENMLKAYMLRFNS